MPKPSCPKVVSPRDSQAFTRPKNWPLPCCDFRGVLQVGFRGVAMVRIRVALVLLTAGLLLGPALPAAAEPATSIAYPVSATATRFTGLAFDTCTAPTLAQMTAWKASPYKGDRHLHRRGEPELRATTAHRQLGHRRHGDGVAAGPDLSGLQAPCGTRRIQDVDDLLQPGGVREADDAVAKAKALGILPASAIYNDMENYDNTNAVCRSAYCTTCPRGRRNCTCSDTCPASTGTRTRPHRTWPRLTTPRRTRGRMHCGSHAGTSTAR